MMKKSSVSRMQRFNILRTQHQMLFGRTVGLVQRFIWIKNFGQNWRRTDGIRVDYFPRIHYAAARPRSPQVHEQNERPRLIPRTNYLHVDVQWHHMVNWIQCIANATLVSVFAKRFPAGRWSFLGLGSEKKWYSIYNGRRQGEWDKVDELMTFKCGASGHPVFRATSPLSRGTLKSKGGGKLCFVALSSSMSLFTVIPQGPFWVKRQKTIVLIIVWLGFHPFRPVHIHIGSGAGNPAHCYVRFGPRRRPSRLAHSQLQ